MALDTTNASENSAPADRERTRSTRRWAALGITLCYGLVNLLVALQHEPWRDEANWWLLVRDYNLGEVFANQSYAGSPMLWCLLLFPLAKLGLPIMAQQLLHLAIATGAVWVLCHHSKLSLLTCALFAAGYAMGFEYAIISRSYALTVLLLFTLIALDRWRWERPLGYAMIVVLLANTNAHGLVFAAMLGLAFAVDLLRQRNRSGVLWCATGLMVLGGAFALVTLLPAEDFVMRSHTPGLANLSVALRGAIFPSPMLSSPFFVGLAGLTFTLCALTRVRGHRAILLLGGGAAGLAYIFVFHHGGSLRHHCLLLVLLLAAMWLSPVASPTVWLPARLRAMGTGLLQMGLLLSVDYSLSLHLADAERPFSGGQEMAEYLIEHDVRSPIAAFDSALITSVLAHLPGRAVWQIEREGPGTWHAEDTAYTEGYRLDDDALIARVYAGFPEQLPWLLLSRILSNAEAKGWGGVFATAEPFGALDERFFLYRPMPGH